MVSSQIYSLWTGWPLGEFNEIYMIYFQASIGSSNAVVPSGNKPLPEPMLTKFCDVM